ncbi:Exonuclease, RNase T/DNA polymerase III [Dillenia turbinata]|uniref:Exonuclease, RNase T/DNA polymerase III n=1 Tax=Dillenia turbinata TaxID=194707 RepID=A0AAN8V8A4_9MAGN
MEEIFASAEKEVLVEIVKFVQKRKLQCIHGGWKEFLLHVDKQMGTSVSDPSRRRKETLVAFLNTFHNENDLRLFSAIIKCHSKRKMVKEFGMNSPDSESPEQSLVRSTLEHREYPSCYTFPSYEEDWVVTKVRKKSLRSNAMISIDCEMVLCEDGSEGLVRVCVVDRNLEVKLHELVKPNKAVADYRTEITGVAAEDLKEITCSLSDIQKSIKKLLSRGTILVGHSLNNDLQVLKLDHARVIDTSFIFKCESPHRRPSLSNLCQVVLGYELRKEGAPHSCLDDACAAMKLAIAKIEQGYDKLIPSIPKEVPKPDMTKLCLHGISVTVPRKELCKVMPGDFTIEIQPSKKFGCTTYSAHAVFKNTKEANLAFESVKGELGRDKNGLPQKLITFELSTGVTASLKVRKMGHGYPLDPVSKKRKIDGEMEIRQCDHMIEIENLKQLLKQKDIDHKKEIEDLKQSFERRDTEETKEIEQLKQTLKMREFEITNLNKIITALKKKKQGF